MTHAFVRRTARLLLPAAALWLATACTPRAPTTQQHDIAVTIVDVTPGPYHAGDTVVFHVHLVNRGPGQSGPGTVALTATGSVTACTASGGATCPDSSVLPPTVRNVPAGGTLDLTITEVLPLDGLGPPNVAFGLVTSLDTDPTNDIGEAPIDFTDARSGTYHVYGSDGRTYDLQLDFPNSLWILNGNGRPEAAGTITSETLYDQIVYRFGTGGRFRTTTDGLVGANDFGEGPVPFVAARSFAAAASDVGTADLVVPGRRWLGSYTATFETATLDATAGTLTLCAAFDPVTPAACPDGAATVYQLQVADHEFTGTGTLDTSLVIHFRLARVADQWVLLQSEEDARTARQFRVGLPDDVPPAAGLLTGGDDGGRWNRLTLADAGWTLDRTLVDGSQDTGTATLAAGGASSPVALRVATAASAAGTYYLVAPGPLGMVVGAGPSASTGFVLPLLR